MAQVLTEKEQQKLVTENGQGPEIKTEPSEKCAEGSGITEENVALPCFEKFCKKCGINKNLVFLKVTLFVMYGATASLLPYLTIHMQSIGLTVEDMAVVYLTLPLTTFLAPPLTGFLVDKFGNYKPVIVMSLIMNLVFHHSLLFIPHQEMPGMMPAAYVVMHPGTGKVEMWWSPCPSRECPDEEDVDMVVDDCEDYCLLETEKPKHRFLPNNIAVMPPNLVGMKNPNSFNGVQLGREEKKKPSNKVQVNIQDKEGKKVVVYENKHPNETKDLRFKPLKKINETKPKTPRPKPHKKRKNKTLVQTEPEVTVPEESSEEDAAFFFVDMFENLGEPREQLGMEMETDDDDFGVTDFRTRFGSELLLKAGVNVTELEEFDLRCGGMVLATNLTIEKLKELAADCMLQKCNFREGGPEVCPPEYKESDDNTFWTYFVLRFIGTIMLSSCVTIMDPIALVMIQEYGGEFGRERLFSSIGMAIFSPLTGVLIDYYSEGKGYTDYSAAFYTYDILLLVSVMSVCMMPLAPQLPADNIMRDLIDIIKMPHVLLFVLFMFLLGNFWGFIESYLFLYLKELGASNYLLGITVTVGTLSSMPFLYGADFLTKKFGHVNVIVVAFFSHAVRLMGYSFIEEPYWCFPFEAMEALSVHLLWVAAATYCALIAPKTLLATLIGLLGMAHFSLGKGSGSFVGGVLMATVGTRKAFRVMGLIAVCGGILYYILHYSWLRKSPGVRQLEALQATEQGTKYTEVQKRDRPLTRDVSISAQRLSLMMQFNQRGSLASLSRSSRDVTGFYKEQASTVDLLRSTTDICNRRDSNLSLKTSTPNLGRYGSKDRIRDSSTSITQFNKRSTSSIFNESTLSRKDSITIPEEDEPNSNKTDADSESEESLEEVKMDDKSVNTV